MEKPKLKLKGLKKKKKAPQAKAEPKKESPIHSDKNEKDTKADLYQGVKRQAEFDAFISWLALPSVMRKPEDQSEFAKQYKVSVDTLTDWKKRTGFYDEVQRRRRTYFKDDSGDVILSLKRKCLKEGSGADVKVFLNYTEDLKDKTEVQVDDELRQALTKINNLLPD